MPIYTHIQRFASGRKMRWTASLVLASIFSGLLTGCTTMGGSGPSSRAIARGSQHALINVDIKVVNVDDRVAAAQIASNKVRLFSEALGDGALFSSKIGRGDTLEVSIWEAPPAVLFGTSVGDARLNQSSATGRSSALPEQMVDSNGRIEVPYAGSIVAADRTPEQVASEIGKKLSGLAHQPQIIVRLVRNASANVTVVGEVANSTRMQVTAKGERLLDALASAGGVRQPIGKVTIQVTRGSQVASLPLEQIIRDPAQNIRLQSDDVVTAMFQPYSFIALGAISNNAEIPFEGTGLTLAQALGRVGGLRDDRANVKGVFVFRLEDPAVADPSLTAGARRTPDGKIPVIYRVDLSDPGSFFVAQGFPIRNHDVVYVSNAPIADLQKFVGIVSSMAFSVVAIQNSL